MTHSHLYIRVRKHRNKHTIAWEDCEVFRYDSNNGIGLRTRDRFSDVLCFISGEDIGVTVDTDPQTCIARATPIFQMVLKAHNEAISLGISLGRKAKMDEIKTAMEL